MEAFKVRLIQEYNELNERIGKLSNFLKNPNGVELSEKMMAVMGGQQVAMEEYSRKLWERMEMLGITSEDVMNPNYTGQNMSFGEALQAGDGNGATNYVPDWVDMFAKDWFVLGGE